MNQHSSTKSDGQPTATTPLLLCFRDGAKPTHQNQNTGEQINLRHFDNQVSSFKGLFKLIESSSDDESSSESDFELEICTQVTSKTLLVLKKDLVGEIEIYSGERNPMMKLFSFNERPLQGITKFVDSVTNATTDFNGDNVSGE